MLLERRQQSMSATEPPAAWARFGWGTSSNVLSSPQALDSYTGRLAPRLALLSRERIQQNVVERVLRWAAMGACDTGGAGVGSGGGDMAAMLAEDAAEVGLLHALA